MNGFAIGLFRWPQYKYTFEIVWHLSYSYAFYAYSTSTRFGNGTEEEERKRIDSYTFVSVCVYGLLIYSAIVSRYHNDFSVE